MGHHFRRPKLLVVAVLSVLIAIACSSNSKSSGGPNGLSGADVEALSEDTFIFLRNENGGVHIYAYDTVAGKERAIAKFEDSNTADVNSLAISPDRKWIAFTSNIKSVQADIDSGYSTHNVVVMSANGLQVQRISDPLINTRSECSTNNDCELMFGYDTSLTCQGHNGGKRHCMEELEDVRVYVSSWSPDGRNVLLTRTLSFWYWGTVGGTPIKHQASQTAFASVPFSGGAIDTYVDDIDGVNYSIGNDYSVSPNGDSVLVVLSGGDPRTRDLHLVSGIPPDLNNEKTKTIVTVTHDPDNFDNWPYIVQTGWDPNGKTALFVVSMNTNTDMNDERLLSTDIAKGCSIEGLNYTCKEEANIEGKTVDRFGISSDGKKLVLGLRGDGKSDVYIKDRMTGKLTPITTDGNSYFPVW